MVPSRLMLKYPVVRYVGVRCSHIIPNWPSASQPVDPRKKRVSAGKKNSPKKSVQNNSGGAGQFKMC